MSKKKLLFFFSSRNSGNTYTPLSIIFSIFSQQFLFPFFLNIASDIWLYWLLLPMSIRNAKWSLPKWNFQWMEREKEKRMKSYFPCWWCLYCCKSQTTVFFPLLPSSSSPVCTFLVTSPPLKTRRWNNITGFLPTFHKFMFEKKEPQIFNEAYRGCPD